MVWWLAAIFANVNIAVVEYLNRTGEFSSFGDALLRTAPCIIMAQYGLYRCWAGAPSFMTAWAFFTAGNLILRLASNHFLVSEPLNVYGWLGVCMVVGGATIVKYGS
jgi:multidrug transporter EmrE-like cation transporter